MAQYNISSEKLELGGRDSGDKEVVPKKRWHIVLGLCAIFAILALVFVILYATEANSTKSVSTAGNTGGKKGEASTKAPTQAPKPTSKPAKPSSSAKPQSSSKPAPGSTKKPPSTALPTRGPGPYDNIRLTKDVRPYHYDVELTIDLKNTNFSGKSSAFVNVAKPSDYIIIHIARMKIKKAEVRNARNALLSTKETFEFTKNQYFVFHMNERLPAGQYSLHFEYEAQLAGDLKGLYKSTYKRKSGKTVTIAATQFQPTDARRAFPCFDEPAMKATFNITMVHDPAFIALTNMPKIHSSSRGGLTVDKFAKTVIMPTYLLAFVVCDFGSVKTVSSNNVNMTYYAPVDQVDQLHYSAKIGREILTFFEGYYNISYPLPKADMIAIPDFAAGAMENWGLITYRETALLFSPNRSSESNKQRVAVVVSHELVHQWFGNLVTNEWWSDLWLNEGFASYVEYAGVNKVEPNWRMLEQIIVNDQASAFSADALVTSHPIYVPVNHPNEINEIFDSISYQKGCSILMMLDHFLGVGVFRKGLTSYLNKYKFGNAETKDLWNSLSEATNGSMNISDIMDTWTLQMGFPEVKIFKNGTIMQKRFLLDPNPDYTKEKYTSPFNYVWKIPFQYNKCNKTSNMCTLSSITFFDQKTGSMAAPGSDFFIKGNAGQFGFYRVNYDDEGWKDIINLMNKSHKAFEPKDRAGVLGDAFALARSNRLSYVTTLDLFDYINKEVDYIPWAAASSGISYLGSLFSKTSKAGRNYPKYMLKKITPHYNRLGFRQSTNETTKHLETYLRSIILGQACGNGMTDCLNKASEYFTNWMNDPVKNAIPADLRSLSYFYGIKNGGEKEWEFAFKQYQNSSLATERIKLLYGMSATQEPWMIERYLNYSLDDTKVKSQDTSYVFSYVSNYNPIGRYYAWYFLKSNWDRIAKKFGGGFFSMRRIFSSVTSGFKTDYELKQFDNFVSTLKNTGTATRTITQSRETIKSNIAWLKSNEDTIAKWLVAHV